MGFSERGGGMKPWEANGYADAETYAKSMELNMKAKQMELRAARLPDTSDRAQIIEEANSLRAQAEGLKRPSMSMDQRYAQRRAELPADEVERPSMPIAQRYEQRRDAMERGTREAPEDRPAEQQAWSEMSAVQRLSEAMKSTDREVSKAMIAALREMTDAKNIVVDNIRSFWSDVRRGYAAIQRERASVQPPAPPRREPVITPRRVTPLAEVKYKGPEALPANRGQAPTPDFLQGPSPSERQARVKDAA